MEYAKGVIPHDQARASIASWLGLAKHANAFLLSRTIFLERDVHNLGQRLLVGTSRHGRGH